MPREEFDNGEGPFELPDLSEHDLNTQVSVLTAYVRGLAKSMSANRSRIVTILARLAVLETKAIIFGAIGGAVAMFILNVIFKK